ncbi:hypothetical protein AXG93_1520s1460 [Marchantia polymorpha subsp. ruderalis]|uniref:Uncharacterized protein n=1 Tax=Marchantia polymorpha subsp. ruderalis TaxID=1480154 RepID=A0A176VHZ2_MARPO|nr:hypothetical protein AXG93_1520s1460 [Marchantia polymorpha subsp. ruderalis]
MPLAAPSFSYNALVSLPQVSKLVLGHKIEGKMILVIAGKNRTIAKGRVRFEQRAGKTWIPAATSCSCFCSLLLKDFLHRGVGSKQSIRLVLEMAQHWESAARTIAMDFTDCLVTGMSTTILIMVLASQRHRIELIEAPPQERRRLRGDGRQRRQTSSSGQDIES